MFKLMEQVYRLQKQTVVLKYLQRTFSLGLLIIIFISMRPGVVNADAIGWIESQIYTDGSYSSINNIAQPSQSTSESLRAFQQASYNSASSVIAKSYLDTLPNDTVELLSRKIISTAESGGDSATLVSQLLLFQNFDGGFGDQQGYQSRIVDTSFALEALALAETNNTSSIERAINYLVTQQNPDGGFSHSSTNVSSIYETSLASVALQAFRFEYNLSAIIGAASDYIYAQLNSSNTVQDWEIAQALIAIVPVTNDVSDYQSSLEKLQSNRRADFSWNQDVYTTAVALRALQKAAAKPAVIEHATGQFTGKVVNAVNGLPLTDVVVKLTDIIGYQSITSGTGQFIIEDVEPGEHVVSISASGFNSVTTIAIATVGAFTPLGVIELSVIANQGIIYGVIHDAGPKTSLATAVISITGSTTITVPVNNDGYFSVEVNPGAVSIAVQADGYESVIGTANIVNGSHLNFSPSLNLTDIAPPVNSIKAKVTVVDAVSQLPVSGVNVSILDTSTSGITGVHGYLELDNLSEGAFVFEFSADGYNTVIASSIATAGSDIDFGIISLSKTDAPVTRTVKGYVTDSVTGVVIPNATILVEGTSTVVTSDADGYYVIEDTVLDTFNLVANADGYLQTKGEVTIEQFGVASVDIPLAQSLFDGVNIEQLRTNSSQYQAYKPVQVQVTLSNYSADNQKVNILGEIIDTNGVVIHQFPLNIFGEERKLGDSFTFEAGASAFFEGIWFTGSEAPGNYQTIISVFDVAGQLQSRKELKFIIDETSTIRLLGVKANPDFTALNSTKTLELTMSLLNRSNVPVSTQYTYQIIDPDSNVIDFAAFTVEALPIDNNVSQIVGSLTYTFTKSGVYQIELQHQNGVVADQQLTNLITVIPDIAIEPEQSLTPSTVLPDGDKRIRVNIRLRGVVQQ